MFRFFANVGSRVISSAYSAPVQFPTARSAGLIETAASLLVPKPVLSEQVRTVIKYSMRKGKRRTVFPVLKRFFRLHWGAWIRTKAGRHKRLWSKSLTNRRALKEHVFCNGTQCTLLDRMVSEFWRRPKYYIDDPYTPYHTREEFYITRRKPWRPDGWE